MQDLWQPTTAGHALTPPDEGAGREITPDNYVHDQEAGEKTKSQLAISFG